MNYNDVLCNVDRIRNLKQYIKYVFITKNKSVLKANKIYKNSAKGKTCFIVGNGPSLNKQDLSVLKNKLVITVNQGAKNKQFELIDSNYHFWLDPFFFNENEDRDTLKNRFTMVNKKGNKPVVMIPLRHREFIEKYKIEDEVEVVYYNPVYVYHDKYNRDFDFSKAVPAFYTVVGEAIAFAIYMGVKNICLLGCDCTGILNYINTIIDDVEISYSYGVDRKEKQRMTESYKLNGSEAQYYVAFKIIQQYKALDRYCSLRNISLINCTEGGALVDLKRIALNEMLKK